MRLACWWGCERRRGSSVGSIAQGREEESRTWGKALLIGVVAGPHDGLSEPCLLLALMPSARGPHCPAPSVGYYRNEVV